MLENNCKLIGFDKRHNSNVLVTGASLGYCEELAKYWIENHPERYESYRIFIYRGFWECRYWYERLTDNWFQKYELKELVGSKKSKAEE